MADSTDFTMVFSALGNTPCARIVTRDHPRPVPDGEELLEEHPFVYAPGTIPPDVRARGRLIRNFLEQEARSRQPDCKKLSTGLSVAFLLGRCDIRPQPLADMTPVPWGFEYCHVLQGLSVRLVPCKPFELATTMFQPMLMMNDPESASTAALLQTVIPASLNDRDGFPYVDLLATAFGIGRWAKLQSQAAHLLPSPMRVEEAELLAAAG